ncbi:MAG TPA: Stp1/IreP family PP2C-type Ser/Thr phosphatase [Acidimicrobiales bacterium]|nr:Stp1/IreP family PP2C-type Ser/Thr phosphatase [Acidimicrobiales bacterium]
MTRLRAGAATDVGRVRKNNEDSLLVSSPLFAVADGMGGHAAGEVASNIAVETLAQRFEADHSANGLAEAVRAANRAVWERAQADHGLRGMGTTITAVALVEDGDDEVLAVVNVGDSRAYRLQNGELEQLTEDHSLVEELRRSGRITDDEARSHPQKHVVTRALGIEPDVDVDCFRVLPYKGDRFLLASDGLFDEVDDPAIASTLRRVADPDEAARTLVDMAKSAGGSDNITVVVVDVTDDGDRAAKASAAIEDEDTPAVVRALAQRARAVKRPRRLTLRVALFVSVVLLVLLGAVAAVGVFARGAYFVGLDGDEVVIFRGRPGGLLWFDPTVEVRTGIPVEDVPAARVDAVRAGKEEPSLGAARRYVENLQEQAPTATTTTSSTAPPTSAP